MICPEREIREAFDAMHVPESVKSRTLGAIEAQRAEQKPSLAQPAPQARRRRFVWPAAVAAAIVIVLLCFGGYEIYSTPTAFVDIDVNPSVELSVNRFDIVVDAVAYNEDGQAVLDAADVKGKNTEDAIGVLCRAADTYIDAGSMVAVAVMGDDSTQVDELLSSAQQATGDLPCEASCTVVTEEEHAAARASGMGVRRYEAAQQLMELDPSVSLDDCADMSMRELQDRIDGCEASSETQSRHGQGGNRSTGGNCPE